MDLFKMLWGVFALFCIVQCSAVSDHGRKKRVVEESIAGLLVKPQKTEMFQTPVIKAISELSDSHARIVELLDNVTRKVDGLYNQFVNEMSPDIKEILGFVAKLKSSQILEGQKLDDITAQLSGVLQSVANTVLCPAGYRYVLDQHSCYVLSTGPADYATANKRCLADKASTVLITKEDIPLIQSYLKDEAKGGESFMIWASKTQPHSTQTKDEDITVQTYGGNGKEGALCVFPFVFNGREYRQCIHSNHHQLWCGITYDYDKDQKWGNCPGPAVDSDSNILSKERIKQLKNWFPEKRFRLCYQASRDGVKGTTFHEKCDNKGPTISVGKILSNKAVFGGYASEPWNSQEGREVDKASFIFMMCDNGDTGCEPKRYGPRLAEHQIEHGPDMGPSFGDGLFFFSGEFTYDTTKKYVETNGKCGAEPLSYGGSLRCGSKVKWEEIEVWNVEVDESIKYCLALHPNSGTLTPTSCSEEHRYICKI